MNISSLIVHVQPAHLGSVQQALHGWDGLVVHAATAEGKVIVTVDSSDDRSATDTFQRIGAIDGVMSVALVYHHAEPDEAPSAAAAPPSLS
ncbi:MAG: chaperone NapD [Aquabacterium sp.]